MRISRNLTFALTLAFCLLVFAARADAQLANVAMAELYISIMNACEGWLIKAAEIALQLLAVTALIGFAIGMKDLVLAGQVTLDAIVALLVRFAFITGLMVWLLNAPQRLAMITLSIKKIGATISGQDLGFGSLMTLFSDVVNPLVEFTTGLGWTDVGLIICMTFIIFLINCLFFLIATTVLVVEIEAVFILIGGLLSASFFVIGYFRDMFLSYIKALAAVGVKMLMLSLCLGIMRNIMGTWPAMIASQLENTESVFSFLMPMSCALLGFYTILKAVPQFASSVLTGSVSGLDGGGIKAAAAAGYGLGATVWQMSRAGTQSVINTTSVVSQAAQTYRYTSQASRDTGSTPSEARVAGVKEAIKTLTTGTQTGGPRGAGERIYGDFQRGQQFADVRNSSGAANTGAANTMASPTLSTPATVAAATAVVLESAAANPNPGSESYASPNSGNTDSWGSFASDPKKKKEGK
jgi:type IV secretory pathway TrbL component